MTSLALQLLLIVAVFGVFYLTLVRPQQIKLRRHQESVRNLRPGDRISTHGGLIGTIAATDNEDLVTVEIAPNVCVAVTRKGINDVWPPAVEATQPRGEVEPHRSLARG